jgi:hypothetical protein
LRSTPQRDDEWNRRARGEAPPQRADRNFVELLQELRVMQTAVTILFALLLTIAFSARFENVDDFQRIVYVTTLAFSAIATGLTVAPVAYHRTFFQRGLKAELVAVAHRLMWMAMLVLLAAIVGSVVLVVDEVIGRSLAIGMGGAIGGVLIALWFVMPASARGDNRSATAAGTHRESSSCNEAQTES